MRDIKFLILLIAILFCMGNALYAADEYDLSYQGAVETVNGAIYQQWDEPEPMGTGVIDAFLGIQGSGSQHGYNTLGAIEFDTKPGCESLLLSAIPICEIGGINYREFLLDINQTSTHKILSVDKVQIFLETTDDVSGYPTAFSTPLYDLDSGADSYVKLSDEWGAGSGKGDMLLFVPDSLFTSAVNYNPTGNNFIYMYSMCGATFDGADGFEEWAVGCGGTIIPEPATMLLLGLGSLVVFRKRR